MARVDDPEHQQSISAASFANMVVSRSKDLPRFVRANIQSLSSVFFDRVTKEDFAQFHLFVRALPGESLLLIGRGVTHNRKQEVSRGLVMCAHRGRVTRREFDKVVKTTSGLDLPSHLGALLFHIFNDPSALGMMDLATMLKTVRKESLELPFASVLSESAGASSPGLLQHSANVAKSFALAGVAGAVGATFVYPIDLVKTRMQNQRRLIASLAGAPPVSSAPAILYTTSWDCFRKTVRNEGFLGLYRGIGPQLVRKSLSLARGGEKEKERKSDFVVAGRSGARKGSEVGCERRPALCLLEQDRRGQWARAAKHHQFADGNSGRRRYVIDILQFVLLSFGFFFSLSGAGASQVIVSNPLEIVKIRLQVMGEVRGTVSKGAFQIVQELGLEGLYKGASACFLRDIPFSAIYFPVYAALKKNFANDEGNQERACVCVFFKKKTGIFYKGKTLQNRF